MKQRDNMTLDRLGVCGSFVRSGSRLADIGTDHALLPIRLVRSGTVPRAIASDINEGPISRARANINARGLSDKISTIVCDGLEKISPDDVDDIVIAGMGGELIFEIIERAQWLRDERYRLILQPMSRPERLRALLCENGFEITDERAVLDAGRYYSVMCVRYTGVSRQPDGVFMYAGLLYEKDDDAARGYLSRHARALLREAQGNEAAGRSDEAAEKKRIAKQILCSIGGDIK